MSGSFVSLIHIVGIGSTVCSPLCFPFPMGNLLVGITSGGQKSNIKALSRSFLLWRLGRLVPDFILPSVLCLSPLTLTSELTLEWSSTALCPAQSAGDPKCSHLCKTFQVKLYSQVLHCGTGTTPLPAASKCSYLLSHCSLVVGSPLYFYKHPNTFSLLSYPPLGGISCFPLPYSVPKNDVICLVG